MVVTPERVLWTGAAGKPSGIDWEQLGERVTETPVLERLRPE